MVARQLPVIPSDALAHHAHSTGPLFSRTSSTGQGPGHTTHHGGWLIDQLAVQHRLTYGRCVQSGRLVVVAGRGDTATDGQLTLLRRRRCIDHGGRVLVLSMLRLRQLVARHCRRLLVVTVVVDESGGCLVPIQVRMAGTEQVGGGRRVVVEHGPVLVLRLLVVRLVLVLVHIVRRVRVRIVLRWRVHGQLTTVAHGRSRHGGHGHREWWQRRC